MNSGALVGCGNAPYRLYYSYHLQEIKVGCRPLLPDQQPRQARLRYAGPTRDGCLSWLLASFRGRSPPLLPLPAKAVSAAPPLCPPPAGGRQLYLMILPPLRSGEHYCRPRVAARRPSAFLRAALPATWRRWRNTEYTNLVQRPPRSAVVHIPASATRCPKSPEVQKHGSFSTYFRASASFYTSGL